MQILSRIAVIAGPRPIFYLLDQAVFDRVVADVIDVSLQVALVLNLVFPEAAPGRALRRF